MSQRSHAITRRIGTGVDDNRRIAETISARPGVGIEQPRQRNTERAAERGEQRPPPWRVAARGVRDRRRARRASPAPGAARRRARAGDSRHSREAMNSTTTDDGRTMRSGWPNCRRTVSKPCAPGARCSVKSEGLEWGLPRVRRWLWLTRLNLLIERGQLRFGASGVTPGASRPITPEKNAIPWLARSFRSVSRRSRQPDVGHESSLVALEGRRRRRRRWRTRWPHEDGAADHVRLLLKSSCPELWLITAAHSANPRTPRRQLIVAVREKPAERGSRRRARRNRLPETRLARTYTGAPVVVEVSLRNGESLTAKIPAEWSVVRADLRRSD